jgi:hypothetical protein
MTVTEPVSLAAILGLRHYSTLVAADKRNFGGLRLRGGGVTLAVLGTLQHGIDAVEDVPPDDVGVDVVGAELVQRPVDGVPATVAYVDETRLIRSGVFPVLVVNRGKPGNIQAPASPCMM